VARTLLSRAQLRTRQYILTLRGPEIRA
jgi:hypothetical protein